VTVNEMTFRIGGEAGQGVESGGAGFAKALARGGLHVFGMQDYMSRVRGGHNFYQVRVSERPLYCQTDDVHLLLALVPETIARHGDEVVPGGAILYDQAFDADKGHPPGIKDLQKRGVRAFPVPLFQIAEDAGGAIMANTAAFGAAAGVTGYDLERISEVIRDNFGPKGQKVIDANLRVAEKAYEYARVQYADRYEFKVHPIDAPQRMVLNGNDAICMGALLGGCRFVSAYPMTPASSIVEWWAHYASDYGLVAKHAEDEISAILMAIGANHAGVRAMTATSGGGFSLMVEGLGLAGITETPVVVVESQRPGPATGMPTRTAQGDLLFVLRASQDEFPRIVLAPGTIEECFEAGWRAFNLAEKYQCPAIVLVDNYLSNSVRSIERADLGLEAVEIDRGALLSAQELDDLEGEYKRYALTESGVSPRAIPGHPNAVFMACSDEHDEYGHFQDEDAQNRIAMVEKRMSKLDGARTEMRAPVRYGPERADLTFVGWGSSAGPIREVVDILNGVQALNGEPRAGKDQANSLHFYDVWPFPEAKVGPMLASAVRLVCVEGNATGQFAHLLGAYTGVQVDQQIYRFDGRPLSPEYILDRLQ
jgi:2-oxoglutarate ferredoxin oxidoreductase subunit alpha